MVQELPVHDEHNLLLLLLLLLLLPLLQVLVAGNNATGTDKSNTCNVSGIAGPDNLFYANHNLFIAEDTSKHQNNFLWAYNLNTGAPFSLQTLQC
jgi:hypothetical protein